LSASGLVVGPPEPGPPVAFRITLKRTMKRRMI
jgi:hypothetical protein